MRHVCLSLCQICSSAIADSYTTQCLCCYITRGLLFCSKGSALQVLDRIKYLLTSAAAPAALQPLLALLSDLARGGADVAHAICDTPGLVGQALEPPVTSRECA